MTTETLDEAFNPQTSLWHRSIRNSISM